MVPILEKCSLSMRETQRVSNIPSAKIKVCTGGQGGKGSRKLDLKSPLGRLLIIQTASV